jgi:hypothetical protein
MPFYFFLLPGLTPEAFIEAGRPLDLASLVYWLEINYICAVPRYPTVDKTAGTEQLDRAAGTKPLEQDSWDRSVWTRHSGQVSLDNASQPRQVSQPGQFSQLDRYFSLDRTGGPEKPWLKKLKYYL